MTTGRCVRIVALGVFLGLQQASVTVSTGATETYVDGIWYTNLISFYTEKTTNYSFAPTGSARSWRADDETWLLTLPFSFPFFSHSYTQCWVDSNGRVRFDGPGSSYEPTISSLISNATIAVLWNDLRTDGKNNPIEDVYISSESDQVTIRWQGEYYTGEQSVNCALRLYTSGTVRLVYGYGNTAGGMIGLSAGDGTHYLLSARSDSGSMSASNDLVFPLSNPNKRGVTLRFPDLTDTNSFDVEAAADLKSQAWQTIYRFTVTPFLGYGYGASKRDGYGYGAGVGYFSTNQYRYGYAYGYGGFGERPFLDWSTSYTSTTDRLFYRVRWK